MPQSGPMPSIDFAIYGSGVLSGLLAGLLARDHGGSVVRIGRRPSVQRLPRMMNIALPISGHPESWQMLRRSEAETYAVLASIGASDACTTSELSIHADRERTLAALDHAAHLAHAFGHEVRRVHNGWAIRHAGLLHADRLEDKIATWLDTLQVPSMDDADVEASTVVLADDDAVLEGIAEIDRPTDLVPQSMMATLIASPRPLPTPIQQFPDRGITLASRPGSTVLALVSGEDAPESRLGATLSGPFPMKRLATTRFRRLTTIDGAPLIGRLKPSRAFVIAGLGDAAAFMAPALARSLAGRSSEDEKRWFAAHAPSRPREPVMEIVA